MSKIDKIISTINYALEVGDADKYEAQEHEVETFLETVQEAYVLVQWPESQDFMEKEWFQAEAVCAIGSEDRFGSAAYFIPIKRII